MTEPQPVDPDTLPPTQNLMLELLAARHRLGHHAWPVPRSQRPIANQLAKLGLVNIDSHPTGKSINVALTDAGKAVMLHDGYTPPILARPQPAPVDLRALAVILARGQDAARDMQDPSLAQALWFMTEQTVALCKGPASTIGNLNEEFARVEAEYQ